jgi:hypothetical protein
MFQATRRFAQKPGLKKVIFLAYARALCLRVCSKKNFFAILAHTLFATVTPNNDQTLKFATLKTFITYLNIARLAVFLCLPSRNVLKCLTLPASEFQKEGANDFSALLCQLFTLKIVLNLARSICFCTTALWHPRKALKGRKKTKSSQETLELALTPGSEKKTGFLLMTTSLSSFRSQSQQEPTRLLLKHNNSSGSSVMRLIGNPHHTASVSKSTKCPKTL